VLYHSTCVEEGVCFVVYRRWAPTTQGGAEQAGGEARCSALYTNSVSYPVLPFKQASPPSYSRASVSSSAAAAAAQTGGPGRLGGASATTYQLMTLWTRKADESSYWPDSLSLTGETTRRLCL
jgi:hypothetical protein